MGKQCTMDTVTWDTRTATVQQTRGLTMLHRHHTYNKEYKNRCLSTSFKMLNRHHVIQQETQEKMQFSKQRVNGTHKIL